MMYLLAGGMFVSGPKLVVRYKLRGLDDGMCAGDEEFLKNFGEDWEEAEWPVGLDIFCRFSRL
jgi:hypothetical protein